MKTRITHITVTILIMLTAVSASKAQTSEWEIKDQMRALGWSYSGETRQAYLKEGQRSTTWFRTFYGDTEYAVVAFSEEAGVLDLDIKTVYSSNYLHRKDDDESDVAMVTFTPYTTQTLGITMTNYSSVSAYSSYKCKFMIFYR